MNVVRAYWAFYNPLNFLRVLGEAVIARKATSGKRLLFQVIGNFGLLITVPKLWRWARKLKRGPIEPYDGLQRARIPMVSARDGREIFWAIEQVPATDLPAPRLPKPADSDGRASSPEVTPQRIGTV
jgi:hypothetical protein